MNDPELINEYISQLNNDLAEALRIRVVLTSKLAVAERRLQELQDMAPKAQPNEKARSKKGAAPSAVEQ